MSDNDNQSPLKIERTSEADAIKSFSHDRPEPDTDRPTERPVQSSDSTSSNDPEPQKE